MEIDIAFTTMSPIGRRACRTRGPASAHDRATARAARRHGAQYDERGRIAEVLREHAAQHGTERRADALRGRDGALPGIHAAGAMQQVNDERGHDHALQAGADAVEHLHRPPASLSHAAATSPRTGSTRYENSSTRQ